MDELERSFPINISISRWKFLRRFTIWECCVRSLPVLLFICAALRSSSSTQRSYRKDYFLGMLSSSSYSFFWPQQSCAGLPKERMRPLDSRVIQQFVLVWSYFPWFPLVFFLASLPQTGRFAMSGMWSFGHHSLGYNSQFNKMHQKLFFQTGAVLFPYAMDCASTEFPKYVFEG